jgi:ADP-dependent NAD(P)H-hydrate dehydratase / NAD(P)H-hydrate epimerase
MSRGCPSDDGALGPDSVATALQACERAAAAALGPGLGRREESLEAARQLALRIEAPLVLDADGLNAHAGRLQSLQDRNGPAVLTPHAGELGRLLERSSKEIGAHRLACAREAALASGAVVLLKGDDTIVAVPGGPVAISPGATPALATAGTGDVLAGMIGALLSKGLGPLEAAAAGAIAHAHAGIHAAEQFGADHVVAGDVIDAIPAAFRRRPASR